MNTSKFKIFISGTLREQSQSLWTRKGSVLVYLIVVLLIFGVLGVTMVSLFTTATSSSATPNEVRRAAYAFESGMRYALSELRNTGFATETISKLNETAAYTLDTGQTFSINVFGPWFDVASENSGSITLTVPEGKDGKIPAGFNIPAGLWMVDYDSLEVPPASARVDSWVAGALTIITGSEFHPNHGDRICLAAKPYGDPVSFGDGGSLEVQIEAQNLFPAKDGAINIRGLDYIYKERRVESDRVVLSGISASSMPNKESPPSSLDLTADDLIVLSPRNHIVIPSGTSDTAKVVGTLDTALNIYDLATVKPMTRKPDIDFNQESLSTAFNQLETHTDFITINDEEGEKTIEVGGGSAIATNPEFGSVWFNADKAIGGQPGVCAAGACEFGRGLRVFFTLDYTGTADGFTFALINAEHNTNSSAGGDVNMGELLGYAGDSRKVSIAANATAYPTNFLDGSGAGLQPPKMALEFDTFTNRGNLKYCDGSTKINSNRNDPFNSNQDAIHYVFWGFTNLTMSCRDFWLSGTKIVDHGSYDDNRHDSGELDQPWTPYTTGGDVRSTPAVADDGTIYVGSDDGHLYALDSEDGSIKWRFPSSGSIGAVRSTPAIGFSGVVYFGSNDGKIYAVNPNTGAQLWSYLIQAGTPVHSPVVGEAGYVYVGADNNKFYGFNSFLSKRWEFTAAGPISYGRPAIGPTGIIYVTTRSTADAKVYAFNPTQRELDSEGLNFPGENEWWFPLGASSDGSQYMPGVDPTTGTIYADTPDGKLIAITPGGVEDWKFNIGSDFDSTPVVGADGTVYFGADDSRIYAINPVDRKADFTENTLNSSREWSYLTGGPVRTIPAIALDGSILAVSNDDNLYAINPDGTPKWTFPISVDTYAGLPYSSPIVGNEGVVYVGSFDHNLYAINNFATPRNYKDKVLTAVNAGTDTRVAGEVVTVDDELDWLEGNKVGLNPKGPWAVRLEVMRSHPTQYEYTLHAWIRQCDSAACGNILGTFYEDTRIEYTATPHLEQTIELDSTQHTDFNRFLFGFTGATGSGTYQSAVIADFKLSFIRPNDPVAP
jgi:outer membrane protein assembly factor BamB